MKKETKDLVKEMKKVIDEMFDNYDNNVYSKEDMLLIDDWISNTNNLNKRLGIYDNKESKNTTTKKATFSELIAKFFGIKK